MGIFDLPFIARIRRNHGLEHATIHLLSRRNPHLSLVGRSDWGGFTLYGAVDTAEVEQASYEALERLRQGEASLAIHPRCGTVLATTGILTTLAAFLTISVDSVSSRGRFRWSSIPAAMIAATAAAIFAQPLGLLLQERYTTSGYPDRLEIKQVRRSPGSGLVMHRVETAQ